MTDVVTPTNPASLAIEMIESKNLDTLIGAYGNLSLTRKELGVSLQRKYHKNFLLPGI